VHGPALASLAQLQLAAGSRQAEEVALGALQLCRETTDTFWTTAVLNLLSEIALHSGRLDDATAWLEQALAVARPAADSWNEGYALGTMAAIAAARGNLREAQEHGEAALAIMREIEQLWGSARALLGLGDLARLRSEFSAARECYLEALGILRQVDARPEIARSLAGLGRIAIEQSDLPSARQHLAESLRLSYSSGSRIGLARGLEMLARLAVMQREPAVALQLAGAVTALREEADLPPMPGARAQRFLDAGAELGEYAVARLWSEGMAMTPTQAVQLALRSAASGGTDNRAADSTGAYRLSGPAPPAAGAGQDTPAGSPIGLTPREREVVDLLARGLSNREIARSLYISPATAARHVANIFTKLGFSSRSQVAAWAAARAAARVPAQLAPNSALTDSPS